MRGAISMNSPIRAMNNVAQRIHESYPEISLTSARRVAHLVGGQAVYKALAL